MRGSEIARVEARSYILEEISHWGSLTGEMSAFHILYWKNWLKASYKNTGCSTVEKVNEPLWYSNTQWDGCTLKAQDYPPATDCETDDKKPTLSHGLFKL